jgi:phage-related protein
MKPSPSRNRLTPICQIRHTNDVEVDPQPKELRWIGSSRADLKRLPDEVKDAMGYALFQAQLGRKAPSAKPLAGFGGAGVLEVTEDFRTNAYRAVYTVTFSELVYVLHVFQKKSKRGIATPKADVDLIKKRLKLAQEDYKVRRKR